MAPSLLLWSAIVWMCKNQLGRRNLTEEQKSYLRGKQYEAEKLSVGGQIGNKNAKNEPDKLSESFRSKREIKDGTAGRIGKQYGVNGSTGKNAFTLLKIFLGESLWECTATGGTHRGVVAPPTIPLRCVMSE